MELTKLQGDFEFDQLDDVIRRTIPAGFGVYDHPCDLAKEFVEKLYCNDLLKNKEHLYRSLGTLGGGNHFY
ncbi:RtcB family protein [Acetobacterium wieringae]|uniref:RtcB family protein n=1 Tax=Acetobacterium wieringae TaxID=52694 RepID=UPI001E579ED1|nr:RtcB family protein [Acetobacterium wieringae]